MNYNYTAAAGGTGGYNLNPNQNPNQQGSQQQFLQPMRQSIASFRSGVEGGGAEGGGGGSRAARTSSTGSSTSGASSHVAQPQAAGVGVAAQNRQLGALRTAPVNKIVVIL